MKRVHGIVHGEVQGVGFRAFTQRHATALGLSGWVRNLYDGNVEFLAEGETEKVREFIRLLGTGPRCAIVSRLEILEEEETEAPPGEFFDIRF